MNGINQLLMYANDVNLLGDTELVLISNIDILLNDAKWNAITFQQVEEFYLIKESIIGINHSEFFHIIFQNIFLSRENKLQISC